MVADAGLQEASPRLAPRGHGAHGGVSPERRLVGHAGELLRVAPQLNDHGAIRGSHGGARLDGVSVGARSLWR